MYLKNLNRPLRLIGLKMAEDHAAWVIIQQVFLRGLTALKFILLGRLLGPESMGEIGVALLTIAIAESLSDTGLSQAIIHRNAMSNKEELGAIFTLSLSRGLLLSTILAASAPLISRLLHMGHSSQLIVLAAGLPLFRSALSPGYYLARRARNFKNIAVVEILAVAIDFPVAVILAFQGVGPLSVLIGSLLAETARVSNSWLIFPVVTRPNFQWGRLREYTSYGKWIWGSSVLSLILNQFDKILVVRLLGATEFGLYQMASKLAQLAVSDSATTLSQYLFPNFAAKQRASRSNAARFLKKALLMTSIGAGLVALCVGFAIPYAVRIMLGPTWVAIVPITRVLLVAMGFGAVVAVLVVYLRAIGRPRLVTQASAIQLALMLVLAPLGILYAGTIGMAWASAIGIAFSVFWMLGKLQETK